jgi:4-amino-4-deoxy-L-arabinose transferase-like glycosyltransferase
MFRTLRTSSVIRSWVAAAAGAGLYLLTGWAADGGAGLVRTVVTTTHPRDEVDRRGRETAVSRGVWEVPEAGLYDLSLDGRVRVTWIIDDIPAIDVASVDGGVATRTVWLAAGFHRVEIRQPTEPPAPTAAVAVARTGRPPQPLPLKPRSPRNPRLHASFRALRGVLGWVTIAAVAWSIGMSVLVLRDWWSRRFPRRAAGQSIESSVRSWRASTGRAIAWALLAAVLVHAALLRLDAISVRYGPVTSPRWLTAVQTRTTAPPESIRPGSIGWQPELMYPHADGRETHYVSDPYTYLAAARTMSSFYGAQFREPLFPFVTKGFLRLLNDQDVAVSFTSAFFSALAVWLTYVLGAAMWSRPTGLLAALGLSLDSRVIAQASSGWRDDAYMAMVTLCAYLMLRWWRARQAETRLIAFGRWRIDATYLEAVLFGVAGGFAILTRIMAVSFLAAGVAYLAFARRAEWRRHLAAAALALVTSGLLAAPYFVNCWRVYGDPLYTFNVHGHIYSVAERHAQWEGSTAGYVAQKIAGRPFEMLDTVAQGLTTYPFGNKWKGLDAWLPGLGRWASLASIAGLIVFAASPQGRLLLVLMVSSLVPFSFTWTVDPDFRFTMHVYPILLIAAAVALGASVRGVRAIVISDRGAVGHAWRRMAWLRWASTVGLFIGVLWFIVRVSPSLVFAEALQRREDATVAAGVRDGASFGRGWSELMRGENVSMRVAVEEATLLIRLPADGEYPVTLRMDPFPRPLVEAPGRLPVVGVALNGIDVGEIQLRWTPSRVGAYDILLPRTAVRRGVNRLVLRVKRPAGSLVRPGLSDGDAVGFWYVRVHPPSA